MDFLNSYTLLYYNIIIIIFKIVFRLFSANLSVFGKVIPKVASIGIPDKVGTGKITYAEVGGTANNVSQTENQVNYEAETSSNNQTEAETTGNEGIPVSVSSKNASGSKSAISPIVFSKGKSVSSGLQENATEAEVESGGMSNTSEVGSVKRNETEIGNQSNNTEQGSDAVSKVSVKTVLSGAVVSGGQATVYDTQSNALATESKANVSTMGKKVSSNYSKEAGPGEQITASEVESYERSNGSKAGSPKVSKSSVTAPSENVNETGTEMEANDRSNGSLAPSSKKLSVPEAETIDVSTGSEAGSTNQSLNNNAKPKATSTSLDTSSSNKSTKMKAGPAGKTSNSGMKTSSKSKASAGGTVSKSASQQPIVSKINVASPGSNAKSNVNLNVDSNNMDANKGNLVVKTQSSKSISGSKLNNTVTGGTGGTEAGMDQADVDTANMGQPDGVNGDAAEGTAGADAGEVPEALEGIQLGPCARYPFRIEGNKVIFDVELNCQL